ncbi:MAG: atpC [Oscillospiraceae bacterium]|jgi:F-type H+-transporting ATPase subunit epsilon|nr:atpC [Oscillospiraceae bacterium]
MPALFRLKIITPDRIFFDGETEHLIVRTTEGNVGILANHIPYAASLPAGALKVKMPDGSFRAAAVADGMIKVSKEKTTVIASSVEWADEIDVERAKKAEEAARERLKVHTSGVEFERAAFKLKRALNRIDVSKMK